MEDKEIREFQTYLTRDGRVAYCAETGKSGIHHFLIQGDNCTRMYYSDEQCRMEGIFAYPKWEEEKEGKSLEIIKINNPA